jgi:hypothetical protein
MNIYERICDYCKRTVDVGVATIDNGMYYHDSCYVSIIGKRLKKLDTKKESGQLTMQEANEMVDLNQLVSNIKEASKYHRSLSPILLTPNDPKNAVYIGSSCNKLNLNNIHINKDIKLISDK